MQQASAAGPLNAQARDIAPGAEPANRPGAPPLATSEDPLGAQAPHAPPDARPQRDQAQTPAESLNARARDARPLPDSQCDQAHATAEPRHARARDARPLANPQYDQARAGAPAGDCQRAQARAEAESLNAHARDAAPAAWRDAGLAGAVVSCGDALAVASDDLLGALADEVVGSPQDEALAQALELALRARHGNGFQSVRLTVTDNVRTMVSLRRDKLRDQIEARVHHMFLRAPAEIWTALGDYLFGGDREAARSIARYVEQQRASIRRPERQPVALATRGRHHDLRALCQAVNERYFAGEVSVNITWARNQAGKPHSGRRSIKLGSYTSRDSLIRVHPALDAAFVPRFFVEYIIYHEMLHHVLPPKQQNGRRELHGPAFLARERQFEDYQAALQWERENLGKLLRRRARRKATAER